MPELPEVETVATGLRNLLVNHRIENISYDWRKSLRIDDKDIEQCVLNACIVDLRRRGKIILVDLDTGCTVLVHLKLTGQLVYSKELGGEEKQRFGAGHPSDSLISKLPDKTTRVTVALDKNAKLFFNDARKFGWVKMLRTEDIERAEPISKMGPDALKVGNKEFVQAISVRKKSIKACLLDQTIIAGCGNIYADESLWLSAIHPSTMAAELTTNKLQDLRKCLKQALRLSIEHGGSTTKTYVNALGERGNYLHFAKVYQRKGLPCHRCSSSIERIKVAGRGTYVCSKCQTR